MKYKKSLLIICLIICLFSITSVCASDVNETIMATEVQSGELVSFEDNDISDDDVVNIEENINEKLIKPNISVEVEKSSLNTLNKQDSLLSYVGDDIVSLNGHENVLGSSPPHNAYSVNLYNVSICSDNNNGRIMPFSMSFASSSYTYKYDFYLKVYDSNGNVKISQRYYGSSSPGPSLTIDATKLSLGKYTMKIINNVDKYVMSTASLYIVTVPYSAYSVSVSNSTIVSEKGGNIFKSMSYASSYTYKYDFYLKVYDSNDNEKISRRYYSLDSSFPDLSIGANELRPGIYTVKIFSNIENYLKSVANLYVVTVPNDAYSVSVSNSTITSDFGGDITLKMNHASSSYSYRYDFYLKVYDINGTEKISQRYFSTNSNSFYSSSSQVYSIGAKELSPGNYIIKLLNNNDNIVKATANLNVVSLPHTAYSVSVSDTIFNCGSNGSIIMNINPNSSSYTYKYDFYLKVYDSNGNERISQRYYNTNSNTHENYNLNSTQLTPGNYTIKLSNNGDDYVMSAANLFVVSVPNDAYSVSVSDTNFTYGVGGDIVMNITSADSSYTYKYDFYLKVYDSNGNERISQRYYNASYNSQLTYNFNRYALTSGHYVIKVLNYNDNHIMSVANLFVVSVPNDAYSVNVSDTTIVYGFVGDIVINVTPANSSYTYKYDFYLKVYDSNGNEKISQRYTSFSSSSNDQLTYSIGSNVLSLENYTIKLINNGDDYVMSVANLTVVALTSDAYSVNVSNTKISYDGGGDIMMNINSSSTTYSNKYDFYLKVYDSNGNQKISQRYYSSSYNSQVTYSVSGNKLSPGNYTVKILNNYDNNVMSVANLTVVALTSDAYSVNVSDTVGIYYKQFSIVMNITQASEIYFNKYDFYLKVYDSNGDQKISQRYYGSNSNSIFQITYWGSSSWDSGSYTVKILNNYDNNVMSTANLYIVTVPHDAYSVNVSDITVTYGANDYITMNVNHASYSSNNYRYDFYLKVYDSNGNERISQRYCTSYSSSSSNTSKITYNVGSNLGPGIYKIKILNNGDNYVMGTANLTVLALTSTSYSVNVPNITLTYGVGGYIIINIHPASSTYSKRYDFYLNIYDSYGDQKISQRYYSSSYNSQAIYSVSGNKLSPGNYTVKIVNYYDNNVMSVANLTVLALTSDAYSVSVSDTVITYGVGGDIVMNITSADSSYYYNYDFYLKVYDSNGSEKVNQRYYSASSSSQVTYNVGSNGLSLGNYTVKIVNYYDNNVMSVANLTVLALTSDAYSVSVSDTVIIYGVGGDIVMNITSADSSYTYKYDFYLKVYDSNGNEKISQRYSSFSSSSQVSYSIMGNDLDSGIYTVKIVNYYENNVLSTAKLTLISVPYNLYSANVSDIKMYYGSIGVISMHISSNSSYYYKYDFYLKVYDSNGAEKISYRCYSTSSSSQRSYNVGSTQLSPGIYTIKLLNNGDNYLMDASRLYVIDSPNLEISSRDFFVDEVVNVNYTIVSSATGILSVYINDTFIKNVSVGFKIELGHLNEGKYSTKIIYNGEGYYETCQDIVTIEVKKHNANLNISSKNIYVGNIAKVDYNITNGTSGVLSIYANDTFMKNVSVGDEIELDCLKAGIYTIKVIYHGDGYFASCENITQLEIYRLIPGYYIDDDEIIAGDNVVIHFAFEYDLLGNVSFSFGKWNEDEENFIDWTEIYNYSLKVVDGWVNITIPHLPGGENEFLVEYDGDEIYDSIWNIVGFDVDYKESPISINIPEITWGNSVILNPTFPKGATGDINILLDSISLANISIGKTYEYKALKGGKHYLTIQYSGDEYFTDNETTVEFYVNKLNSNFNMETTFDSEKYITIPITLNDDANGVITVNINNEIFSGKVINGSFNFTVTDLGAGAHNAIIKYTGDDKYNDIYIAKEITVNLKNSNLNLNITNILKDENLLIKPNLTEGATGTVYIYVDDVLKRTINVGSSYTLVKPTVGQHKIRLVYSGNTYFDSAEKEFSFRVFTIYPIEAVDTQIVYGTDKKFQAKFYDEYGEILANKYVSFIVNGTEYPIRTNSEGIAVLNVDLGIGEYNVTSVSLLDESTTNKLLIFHSIQAESMIIEYGSDTRFKATFLDETANPLKNTRIVFNIGGKDTMVTTDVKGLAILNTELAMGTHYITSINTITDENMTNKVVVVSDINSIITIEAGDINYNQKAIVKVNIDSAYLNADVTVRVTGENGFEQIFTQKAAKTITKELSNLNASKYCVDVKYEDSDLLVIQKNATFNVLKIDPSVSLSFEGETLTVDMFNATGNVEIKVNGAGAEETLTDGKAIKDLFNLKVGENSVEVYYRGDNNYNPLIKTDKYVLWNTVNLDVDFSPEIFSEEYVCVYVYNLAEDIENGALTLLIDDVKVSQDSSLIEDYYDGNYGLIEFNSSGLAEGTHIWKITYTDISNYINVSKSGTFDVVVPPEPDTYRFVLITNKSIIYVPFDKINWNVKKLSLYDEYAAEYYDDPYINYTFSTFTLNGVEYTIIESSINYPFASLYVSFNPNEYKQHDGIFYKVKDGEIVDAIGVSEYENYDGVLYRYVGLGQMTFAANSEEVTYVLINGECYKVIGTMGSFQSLFYKAILNTDYKMVNGKFYTLDGEIIENFLDESYAGPYAVVNGTFYDIDGNSYSPHSVWSIGYELINNNGQLDKVVYGNDLNNTYAVSDGQLCYVDDGAVGMPVKIDMTQSISEDEIIMPSLDNISGGQTVEIKLPSDAIGTVTFTVNGKDYPFDVVNGQANVVIPNLGYGDYPYTIAYSGGGKYSSFISNGSLKVKNVVDNSKIEASNANVLYTTGSYYTIKVYGKDGKLVNGVNVVIKVNGKTFKTLTTTNDVAKFKVTNVPGTYKMTINALGKSVTKTLTVKHLVTLKTVTVKKSAKKLVLTATLGKVNGKYLKNKKITFKFNGKKYTAKTNKKGVAKVTVKSSVLKKLKVGKKVTYQATYLKDTVKKTVKVKK